MTSALNYLPGRLLISISFSNFCGMLSCSSVWNLLHCLLILSGALFLCIRSSVCLGLEPSGLTWWCPAVPEAQKPLVPWSRLCRCPLCRLQVPSCHTWATAAVGRQGLERLAIWLPAVAGGLLWSHQPTGLRAGCVFGSGGSVGGAGQSL